MRILMLEIDQVRNNKLDILFLTHNIKVALFSSAAACSRELQRLTMKFKASVGVARHSVISLKHKEANKQAIHYFPPHQRKESIMPVKK
jgi:hypothetical protein